MASLTARYLDDKSALLLGERPGLQKLFGLARHPKSFVSLDDADHMLSRPDDAAYVSEVLTAWASRYLLD